MEKLEYLKSMTSFVEGIAEETMKGDGEIREISRDLKENYGNLMDELLRIEKLKNLYSRLEEDLKDSEFVEALRYVQEHGPSMYVPPLFCLSSQAETEQVSGRAFRGTSFEPIIVSSSKHQAVSNRLDELTTKKLLLLQEELEQL